MKKRLEVQFFGHVQGVFFRSHAQEHARDLGITGYIENRHDGSVRLVAEGEDGDLRKLLAEMRKPRGVARVENIRLAWKTHTGEYSDFEIR